MYLNRLAYFYVREKKQEKLNTLHITVVVAPLYIHIHIYIIPAAASLSIPNPKMPSKPALTGQKWVSAKNSCLRRDKLVTKQALSRSVRG